jgi:hypothetical protein
VLFKIAAELLGHGVRASIQTLGQRLNTWATRGPLGIDGIEYLSDAPADLRCSGRQPARRAARSGLPVGLSRNGPTIFPPAATSSSIAWATMQVGPAHGGVDGYRAQGSGLDSGAVSASAGSGAASSDSTV